MGRSKLYQNQLKSFDQTLFYSLDKAISILKEMGHVKFDEMVDIAFKLGIDPKQSDQMIRGALPLPHGIGKDVRVIVIATDSAADEAKAAGADEVGFDELLEKVKGGWLDFDTMIATPMAMQKVRTLGRVLGPRGLMPNPKTGTVTDNPSAAVKEAKAGRVEYRSDKTGCVHAYIGKVSFTADALKENATTLTNALLRARPAGAKGTYIISCTVSSTMSPGIKVDTKEFVRG